MRIYDAGALRKPETEDPTAEPVDTPASTTGIPLLTELPSLPLAVSSLSSTGDGKYALATALDGTVGLIDLGSRSFVDRIETGRVGVTSESGSGALNAGLELTRRSACVRRRDPPRRQGVGVRRARVQARHPDDQHARRGRARGRGCSRGHYKGPVRHERRVCMSPSTLHY